MSLLHRNRSTGNIPVYAEDGTTELGFVFQHEDRDCVNPGWHWYAMSHATRRQVGGAFDTQADAEGALTS